MSRTSSIYLDTRDGNLIDFIPHSCILEHESNTDNTHILFFLPDYTLIIGGLGVSNYMDPVEVISQDTSTPVLDCMKNLGNFPTRFYGAVGTTFGTYRRAESEYHI